MHYREIGNSLLKNSYICGTVLSVVENKLKLIRKKNLNYASFN